VNGNGGLIGETRVQANYSKAAEDSWVMRPGMTEMMAPAMYAVYLRRLGDDNSSVKRSKHQAAAPDQVNA
jgi:hypothetical protein